MRVFKNIDKMKSILKIFISILTILIIFFIYPYYIDGRKLEKIHKELKQEGTTIILEGFEFGITKNEFKQKYGINLDSLDYNWQTSYINNGKRFLTTFHGLEVSKEQFIFRENIFNRTFIKTDIFSSVFLNIKDSSFENFLRLKSDFDKYQDQRHSQHNANDYLQISYNYKVSKYLEIEITYRKSKVNNKETERITISFGLNENEITF